MPGVIMKLDPIQAVGRVHLGQITNLLQGLHSDEQPPIGNLEKPITCMSLDCERKLEYLEEIHTGMGRTRKLRKATVGHVV